MRLFGETRQMMEDFWMMLFGKIDWWGETFVPRVHERAEDNELLVSVELPDMDRRDVDVAVTRDAVRIAGEKKREEEKGYYRRESSYGLLERIIDLPAEVNKDQAEAEFSKGLLTIRLLRSEHAGARRRSMPIESA